MTEISKRKAPTGGSSVPQTEGFERTDRLAEGKPRKGNSWDCWVGGPEVTGIYFQNITGTRFAFVPYRGGAPLNQDLLAGHIDFGFGQAASTYRACSQR